MSQSPLELAELRTREILLTQPGVDQLVVDSPPGAGKTGVVERLAMQASALHKERVMVATQTNAQSFDLAERLASGWPNFPVYLFLRRDLQMPAELGGLDNLRRLRSLSEIPEGPVVVIANASKWSFADKGEFDLMVVDEAYQLRDSQFIQISGLARRHVLVGDPGQIAPVISSDISRWQGMSDGPHVPAPRALLRRRPASVLRMALPVSRRLPADSVSYVQPSFYPGLPFQATSKPGDRRLDLKPDGHHPWDGAINKMAAGASLIMAELPDALTGEFDLGLSRGIASLVERMVSLEGDIIDDGATLPLDDSQVGVVCAHRSQVQAVQEFLGPNLRDVYVETAERYQGLERRVTVVHHPLSGRMSAHDFQLDVGRLCVMLSRHRVACCLVSRAGLLTRLRGMPVQVDRVLGEADNPLFKGYRAQVELLDMLDKTDRIVEVSAS